jgi:MoxR-like ATPase
MKLNDVKKVIPLLAKAEIVPLFFGESGVGKTESIRQWANEMGYRFINIRLGQMSDAGDLTGLPEFVEVDGVKMTAFMQPNFFPKTGEKAVVFFDELNRCHPDIIQAVFQAVEREGGIGQYKFDFSLDAETGLPYTIRAAASNPPTDDYTVQDITDKAFMNRFCHIKFEPMKTEAIEYFKKIGVSPEIRDFLVDQPTMMEVEGEDYSLEYVKPSRRNWEALHRFSVVSEELEVGIRNEVYMGLVGAEATHAFNSFVANYDKSVKGIEILDNLKEVQDKLDVSRVDIIDQINDQILDIVKADDINSKRSDNLVKYCTLIPKDSAVKLLRDICTGQTTDSSGESKAICTLPNVDKYIANVDFNKKKYSEFVKLFSGVLKQQEENSNEEK